jgi:hypothetical protein
MFNNKEMRKKIKKSIIKRVQSRAKSNIISSSKKKVRKVPPVPSSSKKQKVERPKNQKTEKKQERLLKSIKVNLYEKFDSKYYVISVPEQLDPKLYSHIPARYIDKPEEGYIDIYVRGVTTILGLYQPKFLSSWRGNIGNAEADRITHIALDFGSRVHNSCEHLAKGFAIIHQDRRRNIPDPTDEAIKKFRKKHKKIHIIYDDNEMLHVSRYDKIINIINPKILEVERIVFSLENFYAGRLDQTWELKKDVKVEIDTRTKITLNKGFWIVDLKTGQGIEEKTAYCQLAAYLEAHPSKEQINGAIVIHTNAQNKNGLRLYIKTRDELKPYYEEFLRVKESYFFRNEYDTPLRQKIPQIIMWKK